MGKTEYQKSYDKKCKALGLKQMPYRESPNHFSAIGDGMSDTKIKKKPTIGKLVITETDEIVYPAEERVLIKKSLLEEILKKLDNTSDFSDVETIEALREML